MRSLKVISRKLLHGTVVWPVEAAATVGKIRARLCVRSWKHLQVLEEKLSAGGDSVKYVTASPRCHTPEAETKGCWMSAVTEQENVRNKYTPAQVSPALKNGPSGGMTLQPESLGCCLLGLSVDTRLPLHQSDRDDVRETGNRGETGGYPRGAFCFFDAHPFRTV